MIAEPYIGFILKEPIQSRLIESCRSAFMKLECLWEWLSIRVFIPWRIANGDEFSAMILLLPLANLGSKQLLLQHGQT